MKLELGNVQLLWGKALHTFPNYLPSQKVSPLLVCPRYETTTAIDKTTAN